MAYATTPTHGKVCRVEKGGTVVAFTDGWNVSYELDVADITSQGDKWASNLPGFARWSGNFSGSFVMGNTEQAAFVTNLITTSPGTKLTDVQFNMDTTANAFTGNVYVNSVSVDAQKGDIMKITVNFTGDGQPTVTSAG